MNMNKNKITSLDIFIGATFSNFDKIAEETMKAYNQSRSYLYEKDPSAYLNCEVYDTNWYISLRHAIQVPGSDIKIRQRYVSMGFLDTGDNKDLVQGDLFDNHYVDSVFIYLDDELSKEDVRRIYLYFEEVAVCEEITFNFVNVETTMIYGDVAAAALEGEL